MTQELAKEFKRGKFNHIQREKTPKGYVYEVQGTQEPFYHVFERKTTSICIDFEKRIYSETEHKEIYPKDEDFGKWAWYCFTLDRAKKILESFKNT